MISNIPAEKKVEKPIVYKNGQKVDEDANIHKIAKEEEEKATDRIHRMTFSLAQDKGTVVRLNEDTGRCEMYDNGGMVFSKRVYSNRDSFTKMYIRNVEHRKEKMKYAREKLAKDKKE